MACCNAVAFSITWHGILAHRRLICAANLAVPLTSWRQTSLPQTRSPPMSKLTVSRNRRQFMEEVGSGMLLAGLGSALAGDLGFSTAFAKEGSATLDFGALRPTVRLMQETPPDKLQP